MQFWGYKRKEGRAGIRNHVLILPTCACGSESCRIVASQVRGAVVMDTAGYDISSVTSMVAAGCNAVIFTTGRGTCTGNAIVPVLKVTANARTYQHMEDNMDVDLSPIVRGEKTYQEMGAEMLNNIQDICNGKMTKAEAFGFSDIAVDHVCRFV